MTMYPRSASGGICRVAVRIPSAMGRSKTGPAFRVSAGARFTVIRRTGISKPEFRTAARTRSRASRTAVSGSPTIEKVGSPGLTSSSTPTMDASSPTTDALWICASTPRSPAGIIDGKMFRCPASEGAAGAANPAGSGLIPAGAAGDRAARRATRRRR